MSGNTVLYQLVHDTGEGYYTLATFHDRPTPEAIAERANVLNRDLGYADSPFEVREMRVARADAIPVAAPVEDFVRAIDRADRFESVSWFAAEALLHIEAMRSAPEDYDPETLARWGIER